MLFLLDDFCKISFQMKIVQYASSNLKNDDLTQVSESTITPLF